MELTKVAVQWVECVDSSLVLDNVTRNYACGLGQGLECNRRTFLLQKSNHNYLLALNAQHCAKS